MELIKVILAPPHLIPAPLQLELMVVPRRKFFIDKHLPENFLESRVAADGFVDADLQSNTPSLSTARATC